MVQLMMMCNFHCHKKYPIFISCAIFISEPNHDYMSGKAITTLGSHDLVPAYFLLTPLALRSRPIRETCSA